jgi:cobyrinic acid a,c-diamide synthase
VLLVVDARSMARSAAALIQGFENFDPAVPFLGVVFNRIGSPRHLQYLTEALKGHVAMPCLGGIARESQINMPERHLGLVTTDDHPLDAAHLNRLVALIETHLDVDQLLAALPSIPHNAASRSTDASAHAAGPCIGVARDRAFCFYYPENLEMLAGFGAKLVYFSPLSDPKPPAGLDGLYLGGGYPELAAETLAANLRMRSTIRALSEGGMPIYAECGGFMYLGRQLVDRENKAYDMAGCFPHSTRMLHRRKALGYREIALASDTILGPAGIRARGHEFHYSEIETDSDIKAAGIEAGSKLVYNVTSRGGAAMVREGYCRRQTLGSYIHLHFGSNPDVARYFVRSCRAYQLRKDVAHETS